MTDLSQRIANLSLEKRELLMRRLHKQQEVSPIQITPITRETNTFPLSFAQQRLWFLDQLEPNSSFYNIPATVHLKGKLNVAALEWSFNEILRRHEALRTSFVIQDGQPVQVIHSAATININVVDLQQLEAKERETVVHQQAHSEAITPFDLEIAPLIRWKLLHLSATEYVLLLTMHHIVSDGWSIGVFIEEFLTLYQAYSAGEPSPLPELTIQYADFAMWQRQWLSGGIVQNQLNYWQTQLAGAPELLQLPTDRTRPNTQTFRGTTQSFSINRELTQQLQTLSRRLGTTLFMTLLAAFATLLYRYSGQSDILIGSPIANRHRREVESLIGLFVNTLVLRTRFEGNQSFESLHKQVRETTLQAYEHQDVPFEQIVEALQPQRALSHSPLFQVMFVLQNTPNQGAVELPGVTVSQLEQQSSIAKFDLTLSITETAEGLVGAWEYNTDLFDGSTIERMATHFQNLCRAIVTNPQVSVNELPLLSEAERQQLLVEWNDTQSEYPREQCIHQLFEKQVQQTPDAVAVVEEHQHLTYQQLNHRANQLAHYLQTLDVGPEVLVGICVERSLEMVVGLLGILKAGGAYVPLDPAYPTERLSYMLSDSQLPILLTQKQLLEKLPQHQAQTICLDENWDNFANYSQNNPDSRVKLENLAYIIYTSGSTGKPKGTMIVHSGMMNYLSWCTKAYNVATGEGSIVNSSIGFDATITSLFSPLLVGGKVVLLPGENEIEELRKALCSGTKFSLVKITPAHLEVLSHLLANEKVNIQTQAFIIGGEALSEKVTSFWQQKAPLTKLINEYGPTETVVGCCIHEVEKQSYPGGNIPIGRPIANTELYILDNHLQPVPIGVVGELYIGGAGVARGYLNHPELTQQKFITNRFNKSKFYKTGDLARYLPNGDIEYLGRIDNQVKLRGFRIELGEIEAVLNTHPQVEQAVVIATEHIPGNKRLVAYVVATDESVATNQLREFLKHKLPEYMMPSAFVTLDTLPLTPNGKVDRKALPAPDEEITRKHEYVAPRTTIEQMLTNIWQELLLKEKVSIQDNFFEIGGDSILSIQVVSRAKNLGIQITPKQIFQNQTITELAKVANTTVSVNAQQGIVTGIAPLTPIQHWFFAQNRQQPHHYNQSVLLHLPSSIKPELLEKAVEKLLEHHDALRLRFRAQEFKYKQINQDKDDTIPFSIVDLSSTPKLSQPQALLKIATEFQASLNLSTGPIMQVVMFNLGNEGDARLLIIIHHLAVDGVSWRILLSDLETIYQQLIAQQPIQLSAKTTAFIDWAEKLNNYAQSEIIKQELDYWLNQPREKTTPLPLDYAQTQQENTVASAITLSVKLTVEETRVLLGSVNEAYNTRIDDLLLSALVLSLAQWTLNSTVVIDLEGHGREELLSDVDLSRTVGWFTSLFPVLLQLPSLDEPASVIKSIKEQLRAIPNRGIGYGILRYLCKEPTVSEQLQKLPPAEISFNYLGQFDQVEWEAGWRFAGESTGANQSLKQNRDYLFDINSLVIEGNLQINWTYSSHFHQRATVEDLAQKYIRAIRSLIEHCQLEDAFGYTPSDFPDAQLNRLELDQLLAFINKNEKH